MIPVQEPVLTAQTKVFSSPAAVAVFSTLLAMVLLLRRWPMQELHWLRGPQALRKRCGFFGAVDL